MHCAESTRSSFYSACIIADNLAADSSIRKKENKAKTLLVDRLAQSLTRIYSSTADGSQKKLNFNIQ